MTAVAVAAMAMPNICYFLKLFIAVTSAFTLYTVVGGCQPTSAKTSPRGATMARAAKPRENKDKKARDLPTGIALLWGEQDQPARGPKPSLTPQRIAEAAVTL